MSMNKILIVFGLRKAEPLVTLQIKNSPSIPVWSSFICGQRFTGAVAQTLKRSFSGNVATDLPQSYIQRLNTEGLAIGDWTNQTGFWPCFVFNPGNTLFFKPGEIDQIILYGVANNGPIPSSSGLLFGIFNNERNLTSVDPFISPVPSTNTYTFTSYERVDITNKFHSYFFVNQQSSTELEPLANQSLVARFRYSPDTYLVQTYTERVQYTPYDLISNVGGLTTYALAIWFILFGRGKYRSWGLVQRYLLRNSPDAKKKDNSDSLLPFTYEKSKDVNNNSTLVGSKNFDDIDERPTSANYFSSTGTPTQSRVTNSLSPNSMISPSYYSVKELNKKIDTRINQKLWFVEQTLNRHYLSGFKLRRYDVDLKKLGFDTSYDDDNNEKVALTPPTIHHNWNNFDSNVQNNHKSIQIPHSLTPGNKSSKDNLNPEEQRAQYPNVAIGQVPLEKKQRGRNSGAGSGNYQQFVNTSTNVSTGVATTSPSSYYGQIPQIDNVNSNVNVNNNSTILSLPPLLQSGGPPQGDTPQGGAPQSPPPPQGASQGPPHLSP
ncbi:hypothetical protein RhiirA1_465527 [Rhizophagus irregularis]|uniref:Uncharacterized protein n=1 Tax=Rhizophagus irregularis TaxID=588596 RepID=A0A2N0RFS9_9GLOM|nr:hypothetical protein RhiirA1_465527 [Rhizophagus irregularis]